MPIHPTAIIDPEAQIDPSVWIGPYVVVEGPVVVGAETRVSAGAHLMGWTTIGARCEIHSHAVIGDLPQDFHFTGERTYCRIGDGTVIREYVTIHRGTQPESATIVGRDCKILAGAHIGHNCELGDHVTLINATQLGGHAQVGDRAILSAGALAHQFTRIGALAMVGAQTRVTMDIPPFMMAIGWIEIVGVNAVGLRRAEVPRQDVAEIKTAFRTMYRSGLLFRSAIDQLDQKLTTPSGRAMVEFLKAPSKRGIAGPSEHRSRARSQRLAREPAGE